MTDVVYVTIPGVQGPPGPPGPPGGAMYEHAQTTASAVWTVNHNLGFRPNVSVRDDGWNEVLAQVVHVSENQTVIYFSAPVTGTARLV